ncbi:AAA family ATPase [Patescibacteria group bacterium]|nr:AAA family ATPase [Patescibacteria group bacterium]
MYLRKIETTGFKSFANKTILDFPQGVTAIVGPNGSGKSNVADAVRWVLGEQSMKSLRGKKSEDIIFTGTDKKAKMSAAVVSLYLDNKDKKIPIDYEEVIVTRKFFRSGESEYLINKSKVRLSDVVDLLTSAGVSQRGYCVITQGMADSILSATPAERMVIFEEATGVRMFQIKKQQTIKKLEATKRNLQRITDLLNEIEPRLSSLKRLASRAQKRGLIEASLKTEQELLYSNMWRNLLKKNIKNTVDKINIDKLVDNAANDILIIKDNLSKNDNKNEEYQPTLSGYQKETSDIQVVINELQKNLSVLEGRIQIENEKKDTTENPEFVPINLGYVKGKLTNILNRYKKLLANINSLNDLNNIERLKESGKLIKIDVEHLFSEVSEGKINLNEKKQVFNDEELKKYISEKEKLNIQLSQKSKKYQEINGKIVLLNQEEQDRRRLFFEFERKLQAKQEELNRLKDNLNTINIELAKFEVRKEDLISEIREEFNSSEFLDSLQEAKTETITENNYFNQEESRSRVRKLKFQLEQIGGIDPLIVEEFDETQKRFDFLNVQYEDLIKASSSLRDVITELDKKIEKIFKESFRRINTELNKYFKMIFAGGKAGLSIKYTDKADEDRQENQEASEDSITKEFAKKIAGIEINAEPPGKKISSLNMLSGGERALTSIAILFAIISNNPPPFSVLDEIDAALDEANSSKLSKIIGEISQKTQFIIITHNREMMKQAGVLYGVTMQNDGVSKIISLQLDEINK